MLHVHILSLFPSFFDSALKTGLMERALENGLISVDVTDPRDFTTDRHRHVDDRPYGGGPGMVLQPDPIARALRSLPEPGRMLCMAPSGRAASQKLMRELAEEEHITILCGRYEGFDGRLFDLFPLEPVAVGDIVLNGGEVAALAVLEAVARLVPGFMGKEESGVEESFSDSLLEYPQFTRPPVYEGLAVPDVLSGGNHAEIGLWHRQRSLELTWQHRPDLLDRAQLSRDDADHLAAFVRERGVPPLAARLHLCLAPSPKKYRRPAGEAHVRARGHGPVHGPMTWADLAALQASFGLGTGWVVAKEGQETACAAQDTAESRDVRQGAGTLPVRCPDLARVREAVRQEHGTEPCVIGITSWPKKGRTLSPADVREAASTRPVLLVAGEAGELARESVQQCDGLLRPVRFLAAQQLEGRICLSLVLDRILGDF